MGTPDTKAVNALVAEVRKRRSLALGLLAASVVAYVIAALVISSLPPESGTRRLLAIVSIGWLVVGSIASAVLAVKNSYMLCPKCGQSFYSSGLFAGYKDPVGQKCGNCEYEMHLQADKKS